MRFSKYQQQYGAQARQALKFDPTAPNHIQSYLEWSEWDVRRVEDPTTRHRLAVDLALEYLADTSATVDLPQPVLEKGHILFDQAFRDRIAKQLDEHERVSKDTRLGMPPAFHWAMEYTCAALLGWPRERPLREGVNLPVLESWTQLARVLVQQRVHAACERCKHALDYFVIGFSDSSAELRWGVYDMVLTDHLTNLRLCLARRCKPNGSRDFLEISEALTSLATRLREENEGFLRLISNRLSEETQRALKAWPTKSPLPMPLTRGLVQDIKAIIEGPGLHKEIRDQLLASKLNLSEQARKFVEKPPTSKKRLEEWNALLFKEFLPKEMSWYPFGGNEFEKFRTRYEKHCVEAWNPFELINKVRSKKNQSRPETFSLFAYIDRAVQGFEYPYNPRKSTTFITLENGRVAVNLGGLVTGMLFPHLQKDAGLELAQVPQWLSNHRGGCAGTYRSERCDLLSARDRKEHLADDEASEDFADHRGDRRGAGAILCTFKRGSVMQLRARLVLYPDVEKVKQWVWQCLNPNCDRYLFYYRAIHCAPACAAHGLHDVCPHCHKPHPPSAAQPWEARNDFARRRVWACHNERCPTHAKDPPEYYYVHQCKDFCDALKGEHDQCPVCEERHVSKRKGTLVHDHLGYIVHNACSANPEHDSANPEHDSANPEHDSANPEHDSANPEHDSANPEHDNANPGAEDPAGRAMPSEQGGYLEALEEATQRALDRFQHEDPWVAETIVTITGREEASFPWVGLLLPSLPGEEPLARLFNQVLANLAQKDESHNVTWDIFERHFWKIRDHLIHSIDCSMSEMPLDWIQFVERVSHQGGLAQ